MSYATANGIRVLDATVHMPRVGVWHADVEIDAEDVAQLGQKVALVVGEQRFHGATMRAFARLERVVARLRGGAGKLHEEVPPRAYRDVPARTVVGELVAKAGEELAPSADDRILSKHLRHWVRMEAPGGAALTALATELEAAWRVLPNGHVWIGAERWPDADAADAVLLGEWPAEGRALLGVDEPRLAPGTILQGKHVGRVIHRIHSNHVRTEVFFDGP